MCVREIVYVCVRERVCVCVCVREWVCVWVSVTLYYSAAVCDNFTYWKCQYLIVRHEESQKIKYSIHVSWCDICIQWSSLSSSGAKLRLNFSITHILYLHNIICTLMCNTHEMSMLKLSSCKWTISAILCMCMVENQLLRKKVLRLIPVLLRGVVKYSAFTENVYMLFLWVAGNDSGLVELWSWLPSLGGKFASFLKCIL